MPTSVRSSHIVSYQPQQKWLRRHPVERRTAKTTCSTNLFRARTAPPAASAQGRLRVNRVDFATSALASAIHNTGHSRPIGTGLPVALPRPNCKRPAQPRQLRRSALDRLRDMSCTCGRQRPGISTAPNPRGSCSRHACPGFCPMAVWRTIAQDRRGADNRPLDSRIKGQGAPRSIVSQCRSLSQFFWHRRTLQKARFSFAHKRSVQCVAEADPTWRC